jgi:hypothetical protein
LRFWREGFPTSSPSPRAMATAPPPPEQAPVAAAPSASSITLPPTFANSARPHSVVVPSSLLTSPPSQFWTQDYATGYKSLYSKLAAGVEESEQVCALVKKRAGAERTKGLSTKPHGWRDDDEGSSLRSGLFSVLSALETEGRASLQLADEFERKILAPFVEWSSGHQGRMLSSHALCSAQLS